MKIIAKSVTGHEFLYDPKTAHKVSNASANAICKALNESKYSLKEGEVWFVHDVDKYDSAFEYAEWQSFKPYKGTIRRVTQYGGWM